MTEPNYIMMYVTWGALSLVYIGNIWYGRRIDRDFAVAEFTGRMLLRRIRVLEKRVSEDK